jgi:hypothetical protein
MPSQMMVASALVRLVTPIHHIYEWLFLLLLGIKSTSKFSSVLLIPRKTSYNTLYGWANELADIHESNTEQFCIVSNL